MSSGIIVFRSDRFDTAELEDELDPEQHPHGRDVADFLIAKFNAIACVHTVSNPPFQEHDQWYFDIAKDDGTRYRIAAHIVDESTAPPLWAIQISERTGMFMGLLQTEDAYYEVDDRLIVDVIRVLTQSGGISNVRQLTLDQFREIY